MSMERFRRLEHLWNWLPPFRAVAEHESVQRAAETLHVSASALSRSVKLLEASLGADVFARSSGGLRLTPLGAELLNATRDAMRLVDSCLEKHGRRGADVGPFRIGFTTELAAALIGAALVPEVAGSVIQVERTWEEGTDAALLQGDLDLVVTEQPHPRQELCCEPLGPVRHGLYVTPQHELARRRSEAPLDALARAPRVSRGGSAARAPSPGWVHTDSYELARSLAARGDFVAELPDLAQAAGSGDLVRIADAGARPVYAVFRTPLPYPVDDTRAVALSARLAAALA